MPAIPLRGDRSAWDAASYQSLHANDIDASASAIHHTLGTSASQAATGDHTHDFMDYNSGSSTAGQLLTSLGSGSLTWLSLTNHSHSGSTSGDGGKLSWDNVWLDAVHSHSGSAEGGKFNITNLSSGAAVYGYILTADGSGSAVWSAPPNTSINELNDIGNVHALDPNDGDVLTWDSTSGSWVAYRAVDWRVTLTQNEDTNDSDKTFTTPDNTEWQILWVWAEYTSTSVAGNRQLEIQLQDSGSNVIGQFQTGLTQAEDLTYKYLFAIGVPDLTTPRDTTNVTTPLPAGTFLSAGQKIRIWDNNSIDTSGDDMIVRIQYASRNLSIEDLFIPPIYNSSQLMNSDKVTLTQHRVLSSVSNAAQLHTANKPTLSYRLSALVVNNSTHTHTAGSVVTSYRNNLIVGNVTQLHTSGSVAFTQYYILAVQNNSLKINSEKPSLSLEEHNPELIVQNTAHLHTSGSVTLTTIPPFYVNNSSQIQASDNIGIITSLPVLGINNSVQAQTSTIAPVNNKYILTINNSQQVQTSASIAITQYQKPLIVNNSSIKTTSQRVVLYTP